jgi:sodium/proline symporter
MDLAITGATFALYTAALLGTGLWASRRTRSEGDFLLASRGLGAWVAGLSYAASMSSGWVFIGFTGFVYANGLSALWIVPGIWAGYAGVWLLLGRRVREEAARGGHVTATDLIAADTTGFARRAIVWTASAFVLFCFIFYIAAQFQAAGVAFASTFDIDLRLAVLIGAAIIVFYSALGGFWAVSVTDMLQGTVMATAAVVLPVAAVMAAGGPGEIVVALRAEGPQSFFDPTGGMAPHIFIGFLLGLWGVGLNQLGQPHLLARLMAVKNEAARRRGFIVTLGWGLIVFIGASTLGLAARALIAELDDPETVFAVMTTELFPPVLGGLILAAVLSAVMSTVDSLLIVCAGTAHDVGLAKRFPGRELWVSRAVMIVVALLAAVLTFGAPESVFSRVLFAWAAIGAVFGPLLLVRTLGITSAPWAMWAAMVTGFTLTVVFNQVLPSGPGAIGERLLPWLPALLILVVFRARAPRGARAAAAARS